MQILATFGLESIIDKTLNFVDGTLVVLGSPNQI